MKSFEIREKFFNFFVSRGHERVESSSLIPAQDPTLLFTNAGMNQFKDLFLGLEKRSYTKAVSIQKCVRAGGKHNDLENVGFTKRHLTFFEMMGNFSFGDYFKKEAIEYAWEFLTKDMNLPVDKLHATVYKTDDESYDIWHTVIGIPASRMHRLGEAENFWQMGDTGPCGPCTEIHIDRGPEFGHANLAECGPACDCDRFLEIWNLVFMQFDRQPDGTDRPLKQTGVDTGMGLERLCSVVQNKDSVFETDLFANIIKKIEELTGHVYAQQTPQLKAAFNVLADHIRSSTFLIADGCAPSNDGRGYVLRKIIRRAALFTQKLTTQSIFPELSRIVVQDFGDIYPQLKAQQELIFKVLESEVQKFETNLVRGQQILQKYFQESAATKTISGPQAFKLYDTFGFPLELINVIAHERGYTVDANGFHAEMLKQQSQSNAAAPEQEHLDLDPAIATEFTGYTQLQTHSTISALLVNGKQVKSVPAGQECYVVAKQSPFFIVGGGQVPDQGWLEFNGIRVPHTQVRFINNAIGAKIVAPIELRVGDAVTSIVNEPLRVAAMKNHTATHMLQSALITLFGNQIKQSGSLVHPDYLRFDFTYHENLTPDDIKKVEDLVNQKIRENIAVNVEYMTLKQATERGALAFFGDKYKPENVRLVEIPQFSAELCGGTHVRATGDIGTFKITEVSSPAAGLRRIFAVTGTKAIELFQQTFDISKALSQEFKVKREEIIATVNKQKEQIKQLQDHIKHLKTQSWHAQLGSWLANVKTINNDFAYGFISTTEYGSEEVREIANALQAKKPGFYFIASKADGRIAFVASVAKEFSVKVSMKNFAQWLKDSYALRGGATELILQGGGTQLPAQLADEIEQWLTKQSK